jgi:pullulanase/glycogen debranching enzyme
MVTRYEKELHQKLHLETGYRKAARSGITTGMSNPLGAALAAAGVNFSLFSRSAAGVELLFFDREDDTLPSRIIELEPPITNLALLACLRPRCESRPTLWLSRARAGRPP